MREGIHDKRIRELEPGEAGWAVPWAFHDINGQQCLNPDYPVHPAPGGTVRMRIGRHRQSGRYYVVRDVVRDVHAIVVDLAPFRSPEPELPFPTQAAAPPADLQPEDVEFLTHHGWDGTVAPPQPRRPAMGAQITRPQTKKAVNAASRTGSAALLILLLFVSTLPWWGAIGVALAVHAVSLIVGGIAANRS